MAPSGITLCAWRSKRGRAPTQYGRNCDERTHWASRGNNTAHNGVYVTEAEHDVTSSIVWSPTLVTLCVGWPYILIGWVGRSMATPEGFEVKM